MRVLRPTVRGMALGLVLTVYGMPCALGAHADPPPACHEIQVRYEGREYLFKRFGVDYYRWNYTIYGDSCISRAVSHWTIQFCGEWLGSVRDVSAQSIDRSDPEDGEITYYLHEIGYDPTTGLVGLKWEHVGGNELDKEGEYDTFSFVSPGKETADNPLRWVSKGGRLFDGGNLVGPGCFPPISAEETTWGRLKSIMR